MRREGMARFFRTVSPQSLSSSQSSRRTLEVFGSSPAVLTASFQLGKHCETKYSEIPESATNSDSDGARPIRLAIAAMESRMSFLTGIGSEEPWPKLG